MTARDRQALAKANAAFERDQRVLDNLRWFATKGDWQALLAKLKTREFLPDKAGQR